ncbi:MAG: ACP phosphodiesterase [Proteobacteria bacterium]|nr:ACP phosphodiesterase [Pseudomonadota bacterium]
MNHLAHLALANALATDDGLLLGGFLGDFVKGRLKGELPDHIETCIQLHRAIDAFTDSHVLVKRSQSRFPPEFRRYSGIITDILFDYLLANRWHDYYDIPLEHFSPSVLDRLCEHLDLMPPAAARYAERMRAANALAGYQNSGFIERSLTHLGTRLTRENPLAQAYPACHHLMPEIEQDFAAFYTQLIEFCGEWWQTR